MNKLKRRLHLPLLNRGMKAMPVVVVSGARQTGKTTLVRDLFPQDVIVTQYGRPTRIDSRTSSISIGITAKF